MSSLLKPLIRHLWLNNKARIIEQSIINCHAVGVDSIMLIPKPEVRLFVAHAHHQLYKNVGLEMPRESLSVGFHTHHCDLTLVGVYGSIYNWVVIDASGGDGFLVEKFLYESAIKGSRCKFTSNGFTRLVPDVMRSYWGQEGTIWELNANQLHTVGVEKGRVAAWLVMEGKEDPDYTPVTYSNNNLELFNATGLYEKADEASVLAALSAAQLAFKLVS